jgi:hypothetical protein
MRREDVPTLRAHWRLSTAFSVLATDVQTSWPVPRCTITLCDRSGSYSISIASQCRVWKGEARIHFARRALEVWRRS